MDHYFIFVYEDSLSIEDQRLFVDHVKSLLPTEDEICYCRDLASQIGPVLNRKLTYIANLDISSPKFMMCSWTNFQDIGTHNNFFPPYLSKNNRCDHHTLEHETSLYLSEAIHALADQLPQNGTYHLDVLFSSGILEDLEISHHLDLAGAFHRLSVWHHASFSIICQSVSQNDAFQEWFKIINIQVISKNEARNVVLWRGNLSMKQDEVTECEYLKWLQLTLDPETSKRWLTLKDVLSIKSKHAKKDSAVLLSPEIEFLDQCCVSTIPSYMFSPVNFTLTVTGKDAENEDTYNLLRYLNTNSKVGLVLRLKYGVLKRSLPSVNFCNVREWKKAVADGNIQLPKCNLEADEEHVIFIANQHRNLPNAVSVYLLNDLSQLNSRISYDILATDSLYKSKLLKISSKKCETALNGLPHCTSRRAFINYLDILGEFQVESITACTRHLKEKNSGKETELNIQEIQLIFNFIEDWLISRLDHGKNVPPDEKFLRLDPNEMDSWDWPERLQLLRKQIEADKKAGHLSQSIIVSPQKKTTVITAKDMGRFFNEFGEASAITEAESISIKKKILYGNYEADGIQELWPDVLRKAYHGVFYNCSQATEEEEISRAKLKDSLVVYETASTCSNSQLAPNYTILPLKGKNNKKHSSHSSLETNAKKSLSPKNGKTRASNSQKKTGRQQQESSTDTQNFLQSRRKNFIPVRRSPRKRPVPTPATSKRRKNVEKVEFLSEKHKMKLREAVVIALEKHGIDLDHSMFKPCARKLFAVCKPFIKDIIGKGSTSSQMQRIAAAHVKQVMEFEMQKN